jgi:RNA polymerase sigma factor (sigma-70 family)
MQTGFFSGYSDEQLVHESLDGNNNSLGILYNRYYPKVYQKCLSFTKNPDDAFDYSQDILLKAFTHIHSFKGNSKFSTWLFSITHNHCISQNARDKKLFSNTITSENNLVDDSMDTEEYESRMEYEIRETKLKDAILEIPEYDRQLLTLKYNHNYSVKDLQTEFQLSASAVKMRLMRARQKVERCYQTAG